MQGDSGQVDAEIPRVPGREPTKHGQQPVRRDLAIETERDRDVQAVDDVVAQRALRATARRLPGMVGVGAQAFHQLTGRQRSGVAAGRAVGHAVEATARLGQFQEEAAGRVSEGHGHVRQHFGSAPAFTKGRHGPSALG